MPFRALVLCACLLGAALAGSPRSTIAFEASDQPAWVGGRSGKTLKGEFVHNVGALQMNVTNWGVLGSFPGLDWEMSDAPSAQWPAGSGVEYLYASGLWVGARLNGIPRVSTAYPDYEYYPGDGTRDTVYESFEGNPGGNRPQHAFPDDDNDGSIDEDPLNGRDDDGDGRVDEDHAAISNQMFRCSYRDDYPQSMMDSQDHYPLGIEVVQESYQWEQAPLSGLVALDYTIHNRGQDLLEDLYVGLYVDPDIGHRLTSRRFNDDRVAFTNTTTCVYREPYERMVRLRMVEAWDGDGDLETSHPAPGRFALMLIDHTVDLLEEKAPYSVGMSAFHSFSRVAPFSEGGEAVTDEQRYELLSVPNVDNPDDREQDFRYLFSTGPFQLATGDSVTVRFGFLVAADREELLDLAVRTSFTQEGFWYDLDGDHNTGSGCREAFIFDPTRTIEWWDPCSMSPDPLVVNKGEKVWVNADCMEENMSNSSCGSFFYWCTGTGGRETRMPWIHDTAPPPPNLRIWATEDANVLFWDDSSEQVPDGISGEYDFEGYRIWRADNWNRPPGSSVANGPPADLWMLLDEIDQVNGLEPDRSLDLMRYHPNVDATLVTWYESAIMDNPWIHVARDHLPPVGFSLADADTAIALARGNLGLMGGLRYYRYQDRDIRSGLPYFYSVTAMDHVPIRGPEGEILGLARGLQGNPNNGFKFAVPGSRSQPRWDYDEDRVYVVPNPASAETMAPWALFPNRNDPTGLKVEFRHLPGAPCTIRIWTLAGDLVQVLHHDESAAVTAGDFVSTGTRIWDLVSRNGQQVASGVYLFTVDAPGYPRKLGKFTVIR